MKFTKLFLIPFVFSLLTSCSNDDQDTTTTNSSFDKGFFILNEGSTGQSTVSFSSFDYNSFTKDVYKTVNGNDVFGKYAQNIFFNDDKAYIITGSNVINIVDRHSFKLLAKVESGLTNPRYGVVKDGKAYITNANSFSSATDDYVAILDLSTNTITDKINLNATANRILLDNGKLYITEPYSNTQLLIVNPNTKTVEETITIGDYADTMEIKEGILYTLRSPFGDRSEIVKIKLSDKSISRVTFPETLDGAGFLALANNQIYYTVANAVYAINTTATEASTEAIFSTPITYLYGFTIHNNQIYMADAVDFKSDGSAYIYSLKGDLQKQLTLGVGPNGFYFNN